MVRETHRIMPYKDGGWQTKRDGDQRAIHRTGRTCPEERDLGLDGEPTRRDVSAAISVTASSGAG